MGRIPLLQEGLGEVKHTEIIFHRLVNYELWGMSQEFTLPKVT